MRTTRNAPRRTTRHAARLAGAALVLVALLAGCGEDPTSADSAADDPTILDPEAEAEAEAEPVVNSGTEPAAEERPLPDGEHQGRLVEITDAHVTVDLLRVLTGEEAIAAAKANGEDVSGGLPNDVYVEELGRTVRVPISGQAGVRILDCSAECAEVGSTVAALASGEVTPYGGAAAVVDLVVDGGQVVSLAEIYLP